MKIGFLGCLSLLFIALKICGVINWPLWVVLLPIWLPAVLCLVAIVSMALVFALFGKGRKKWSKR